MRITINNKLDIAPERAMQLAQNLITRKTLAEGSFDYGLETVGLFDVFSNESIQVWQTNNRKSKKAPISITIEKHTPISF